MKKKIKEKLLADFHNLLDNEYRCFKDSTPILEDDIKFYNYLDKMIIPKYNIHINRKNIKESLSDIIKSKGNLEEIEVMEFLKNLEIEDAPITNEFMCFNISK